MKIVIISVLSVFSIISGVDSLRAYTLYGISTL